MWHFHPTAPHRSSVAITEPQRRAPGESWRNCIGIWRSSPLASPALGPRPCFQKVSPGGRLSGGKLAVLVTLTWQSLPPTQSIHSLITAAATSMAPGAFSLQSPVLPWKIKPFPLVRCWYFQKDVIESRGSTKETNNGNTSCRKELLILNLQLRSLSPVPSGICLLPLSPSLLKYGLLSHPQRLAVFQASSRWLLACLCDKRTMFLFWEPLSG